MDLTHSMRALYRATSSSKETMDVYVEFMNKYRNKNALSLAKCAREDRLREWYALEERTFSRYVRLYYETR